MTLAKACGSSAMILAMHYVQVACIVRHGLGEPYWRAFLAELPERQYLIAFMTSENGTFGEMRASLCAVRREGGAPSTRRPPPDRTVSRPTRSL